MKKILITAQILSFFGFLITGYLSYTKYAYGSTTCAIDSLTGCSIVTGSSFSQIGPIPVAILGFITWTMLLILARLTYLTYTNGQHKQYAWASFLIASIGLAAAGYFNSIMLFQLNAFCFWCETSHSLMLGKYFLASYVTLGDQQKWLLKSAGLALVLFITPFALAI